MPDLECLILLDKTIFEKLKMQQTIIRDKKRDLQLMDVVSFRHLELSKISKLRLEDPMQDIVRRIKY